jgi:hypothetical protein
LDAWAWQVLRDPNAPASVSKVAWCIHLHMNRGTGEAFPSIATIARETALSTRTVFVALKEWLEKSGHIKRKSGGGRHSNRYKFLLHTEPMNHAAPVKRPAPVKQAAPMSHTAPSDEADRIPAVKGESPEPLTEPPTEPHHAHRALGDEQGVDQEKRGKEQQQSRHVKQDVGSLESVRKSPEAITQEVRDWSYRQDPTRIWTWDTAEAAILEAFEQFYLIAPYQPARREPKDIRRLDDWKNHGWNATICVGAVQHALAKKLEEGDPLASLRYVEQTLKAHYAQMEQARRRGGNGDGGGV